MPTIVNKRVAYNGDYANLQLAFNDIVANYSNLVALDQQWNLYIGQSAPGNNLWTLGFFNGYTFGVPGANTVTTDSTRFVRILPEIGLGFGENQNKLTNKLQFNPANGIAIDGPNGCISIFVRFTQIIGLQMRATSGDSSVSYVVQTASARAQGSFTSNCFVESQRTDGLHATVFGSIYNSIVVTKSNNAIAGENSVACNCTIVSTDPATVGAAFRTQFGNILSLNNCVLNFGTIVSQNPLNNTSSCNYTNNPIAPANWGVGSVTGIVGGNQFVSLDPANLDLRLSSGSDLVGKGVRRQQYTSDIDIIFEARGLATPSVGAWEIPWDVPRGVTIQSDQIIAKGIARGIERGIV
jgi:hypothetical protein